MLSEISQRSNQLPSIINTSDQKSPYLLQYKVFEQRLKRQQKAGKPCTIVTKTKKIKSYLQQDYVELTRNILNKKQNLNLLEDLPLQTQPSISHNAYTEQLAAKTRMLFQKKVCNKRGQKPIKQLIFSQSKQNINDDKSRVRSESNTHSLKFEKPKDNCISFIGYKRNKKPIIQLGFKRILDFA